MKPSTVRLVAGIGGAIIVLAAVVYLWFPDLWMAPGDSLHPPHLGLINLSYAVAVKGDQATKDENHALAVGCYRVALLLLPVYQPASPRRELKARLRASQSR